MLARVVVLWLFIASLIPVSGQPDTAPWSYDANSDIGPESWGDQLDPTNPIDTAYPECDGRSQSPIAIRRGIVVDDSALQPLSFRWSSLPNMTLNNDGRVIRLFPSTGATPSVVDPNTNSEAYDLAYMELHSTSEHSVMGSFSDAEVYLVHRRRGTSRSSAASIMVVSVRLGAASALTSNELLSPVFDALSMPSAIAPAIGDGSVGGYNHTSVLTSTLTLDSLVASGSGYFTYTGSLTAPPCTAGVTWYIVEETAIISTRQLSTLRIALALTSTSIHNRRPLQAPANRQVRRFSAAPVTLVVTTTDTPLVCDGTARKGSAVAAVVISLIGLICCVAALALRLQNMQPGE